MAVVIPFRMCLDWYANYPCYCSSGSVHQILDAHLHYVQGVAWDPQSKYIASLSSDRSCRIYVNKPQNKNKGVEKLNYVCQHVITKSEQQVMDDSKVGTWSINFFFCRWVIFVFYFLFLYIKVSCFIKLQSVKSHLFHDETLPSFFRRLKWSPDGSFLLVPAGMHKYMNRCAV